MERILERDYLPLRFALLIKLGIPVYFYIVSSLVSNTIFGVASKTKMDGRHEKEENKKKNRNNAANTRK